MLGIRSRDSSRETIAFHEDSGFIVVSVRLARSLEEILIPQEGLRLTKLLEESHPRAGRGGDIVFMVSLVVMTFVPIS